MTLNNLRVTAINYDNRTVVEEHFINGRNINPGETLAAYFTKLVVGQRYIINVTSQINEKENHQTEEVLIRKFYVFTLFSFFS